MLEEPQPLGDLALAPDECRGLWRQMGRRTVEAPQRREVRRPPGDDRLVDALRPREVLQAELPGDRKSTRLNSSHRTISYAVFCLKKKNKNNTLLAPLVYIIVHFYSARLFVVL